KVRLGDSGLKVSRIILGTMQYGEQRWQPWVVGDEAEVIRHIKAAYDVGIQTFDTANVYSNGVSDIMLGKATKELKLPREEIMVMTKHGYVNQHGLSRKHMFDSVKASLERLRLDCIDVLQCHRFDKETPIEETVMILPTYPGGYVRYTKKRGISMAQASVAWMLTKDISCAPIVGTTSLKNLEDIIGAVNVTLTPEEMAYLE
ncbi:hypothetical protein AN958_10791, partial [Leucoagaricus sp. SymC.cos]